MTADHPRSRGVYPIGPIVVHLLPGIIPARAGFTPGAPQCARGLWDHPRSRGVYPAQARRLGGTWGSSPLARGLQARPVRALCSCGIIPARAGFTLPESHAPRAERDHPRSRGVYDYRPEAARSPEGSSPLARGLPPRSRPWSSPRRIIPARAGFTPRLRGVKGGLGDHPRSRGVYWGPIVGIAGKDGSSPLARGLPCDLHPTFHSIRIIPARAGFTSGVIPRHVMLRDHPRSRGVYLTPALTSGLSSRIIPARAGFTPRPGGRH